MKLTEIDAKTFESLASLEPSYSIFQSSIWANYQSNNKCEAIYVVYKDDSDILEACAMLLIEKESLFSKKAYCPYGFLINYYENDLLADFHSALAKYLKSKKGVKKLVIEPNIKYTSREQTNDPIINTLLKLGYKKTNDSFYYVRDVKTFNEDKEKEYEKFLVVKTLDDSSISEINTIANNKDYTKLYSYIKDFSTFIVIQFKTTDAKIELNNIIESLEGTINNNQGKDISDLQKQLKTNSSLLQEIIDVENKYGVNPLLSYTCLVDYNNTLLQLFNIEVDSEFFKDCKTIMNNRVKQEVIQRNYKSFISFDKVDYATKVDLIGEYTCNL